jgi:hypothetical protein
MQLACSPYLATLNVTLHATGGWLCSAPNVWGTLPRPACGRGEWAADEQHGRGAQLRRGSSVESYCGEWQRGREHGWGVYYGRPPAPSAPPEDACSVPSSSADKSGGGGSSGGPGWFMFYVGQFKGGFPTAGVRLEGPAPAGGRLGPMALRCLWGGAFHCHGKPGNAADADQEQLEDGLHFSQV